MFFSVLSSIWSCIYTALLFTWTDYKTIFVPVLAFASGLEPHSNTTSFARCCAWVWLHLLLCNVSNQALGKDEDALNRPWRPLPSGRVSVEQARRLRMLLAASCPAVSFIHSGALGAVSLILVLTTFVYDECKLSKHPLGKNFCNVFGYVTFQAGATLLLARAGVLSADALSAIALAGATIFTTIQLQDFPDIVGDAAAGRVTFPIYAPEFSRWLTVSALLSWSLLLSSFWAIGTTGSMALLALGAVVGVRCVCLRSPAADAATYRLYGVWLVATFLLPWHARAGVA
ncbi:UbiA prenyltransferase family [Vararia minispora EC-137]|uniref:UbiA prenyltransferase family n=1 Tax=Vararia minispora EC-137 TaxID=1314806 RepID=A0ACB8QYP1_9AGAM|nr:UbiA prenyltransferase family [Vararia minispora EC-137]